MLDSRRSFFTYYCLFSLNLFALLALVGCGPNAGQPAALSPYDRAKDAFKNGQIDKALGLTDKLARKTPPADSTDRARVLRAVIYTGELKGAWELAEAYGKGAETAKNPQFQSDYRRLHNDNQSNAARAALNLAETAHQIAPGGAMPKQVTLEASFPITEGPTSIAELERVEEGGWIESDEQDRAADDAVRKGVDDALADLVSGDRSKARQALANGSTQLDGAAFAIFLAKELADGAAVFDRHHGRDPQKLIAMCDEGDLTTTEALSLLKESPNNDEEKQARKLQDQFKTIRKDK